MSGEDGRMTTDEKLVYMVNQIARNFGAMEHDHAAAATEDHIVTFWDPRMKTRIVALAEADPQALLPAAARAVAALKAGITPEHESGATRFASVNEPGASDAG
jgi:formate dehydrogenase subunit delta